MALTEALYEKGYIDGKTHAVNLANLYLLHGIPYKAAKVLEKELAAKSIPSDVRNLRLRSQAWYTANVMYGMALFNQKKLEQARRAFQAAGRDKRSQRTAQQWIKYVDSEIRRRDTLEQKLPEMQARDIDEILKANTDALQ